jgi:hypothetical protein
MHSELTVHSGAPLEVLDAVALVVIVPVVGAPPPDVVAAVAVAPPAEIALVVASPPPPDGESPASGSVQPWTRARAIVAAATIAGNTGALRIDRA